MVPPDPVPGLYLLPLDDSFFPPKRIALPPGTRVRIGRQLNQKSAPGAGNGVFESRVLSRQHAEAWIEGGRMLIRDVKSSNGTFVNGERLSLEGAESDPFELRSDDILEFGIDIVGEHGEVVHRKVAARVTCAFTPTDAQRAVRAETRVYPPPTVPSTPPPVPPLPPNIHDLNSGSNSNGAASGSPDAPRRPQHGTGLAGMGGMGAERIRPKSGVDFDSIIARIRDGPSAAALAALSNPTLVSSASAPATVSIPTLGSPVPPFIPPTTSMPTSSSAMSVPTSSGANNESSNDMNTTQTNAADSGEAEEDPHAAALAQLRAELASTQAALEEAVRAAAGLVISTAGQGSTSPSDVLSESANHDGAHSDSVPSSDPSFPHADSPSATPHGDSYPTPDSSHDGASPLHASTLSLRAELAALRTEASELQRARSRRARARTIIPSSYSPGSEGYATVKEKGKGKAAQTSAAWSLGTVRRTRLGVDALEDLEIDGGGLSLQDALAGDGDGEDEEGDGDGDGDEEGGRRVDEDWADDIDFGAEVADMTPTPTLSRSTFRSAGVEGAAGWRGLRGVFDVDEDEGFPSSLAAMHTSPTQMDHGNGVSGREEEGKEGRGEAADGEEAEHLRTLSAQLDAVSLQLGTLHGRLAALQSASVSTSPTTASPTLESVGAIDGGKTTEGEKAAVDGGRLEGLEGRVRALEGAVISAAPSPPSTSNDDTAVAAPAHAISIDGEAKEIQASLAEGLAALQAEWAAFRAEAASYDPPAAAAMTAAVAPAGVYAHRDVPPFARGMDVNVGAASRPYASGSSLGPGAAMGRATFGRRSGRKWMEMYDPGADAGGDSSSSLSDTDGPVGSDSGDEEQEALRPPRHARQAAQGDDDDTRIPGRWGLLTPEGSMRGGASAATPTALWNAAKSNALDAWANGTHLGPESALQSAQLSTGAGGLPAGATKTRSVRPTKRGGEAQGWARTQTDAEQTLLLAGAVGAGVMIVVAAWWGA